jgi:hypothetical protein
MKLSDIMKWDARHGDNLLFVLLFLVIYVALWFAAPPNRFHDTTKTLESRQGQIRLRSVEILEHIEGLEQSVGELKRRMEQLSDELERR